MTRYAIAFEFPESDGAPPVYAGLAGGAYGWAPTLETALIWNDPESAERVLTNGYGPAMAECGRVVAIEETDSTRVVEVTQ